MESRQTEWVGTLIHTNRRYWEGASGGSSAVLERINCLITL